MAHVCDAEGTPAAPTVSFRAYRQFNDPGFKPHARADFRLDKAGAVWFPSDGFPDRLARALSEARIIRIKELLESFEFFDRVRRTMRAPAIVDLCCGHGLVGMLFGVMEREVEEVYLVDKHKPKAFEPLLEALCSVAPWLRDKVHYIEAKINRTGGMLPKHSSVIGVHACGIRTDYCIDTALELEGNLAILPCCYGQTGSSAPHALRRALGVVTATDVHRTYRLEQAGYQVNWSAIPAEITPMNRIIHATRNLH